MIKYLIKIIAIFFLFTQNTVGDIIKDIILEGNNRISRETLITYGNIELNKNKFPTEE